MATIGQATHAAMQQLRDAAGDDARLEAEVLIAYALDIDRTHLLACLQDAFRADAARRLNAIIERRRSREPLAYITAYREFYSIDLSCTPAALIPRPETEMLVDLALEEIARRGADTRIVDVGTGTGAVAVAIAKNAPDVRIITADASDDALAVAVKNIHTYGLESRVTIHHGDLLSGMGAFDVILANLPYVTEDEWETLQPEIKDYEPRDALVGGTRGTEIIERLIAQAPQHLALNGVLAAEIGESQADELLSVAHRFFPDAHAYVMKDFAGKDRVLVIRREGDGIG